MKRNWYRTAVWFLAVGLLAGFGGAAAHAESSVEIGGFAAVSPSKEGSGGIDLGDSDTISRGIYIGDVDVSGMTADEAEEAVADSVRARQDAVITLQVGEDSETFTAGDFGLAWSNQEVVDDALTIGKSGNIIKRYKDNKDLENDSKVYEMEYTVEKDEIKQIVRSLAKQFDRGPSDAQLSFESGSLEVIRGEDGIEIDVSQSVEKVRTYLLSEWDGGSAGIDLVADVKEPEYTTEDLELITDVLGTATTYYGSTAARNQNVENGAAKLNGQLIMPGEEVSVTELVAPFTEENGYLPAPSYESGKVVDSYGGGICQVSTTLYNAVLKAELEVIERYNHTMTVSYVDPSKDAAIAEGTMDFRFRNSTDAPIYISGYASGGELTFTIYGHETRDPNRTIEFVSETTGSLSSEGVILNAVDQPVGYLSQTQSPKEGLTAVLWKYITVDGETTKEQVNSSTYQAVAATYDVGTSSSDPSVASAIQSAVANNDLAQVQAIIGGSYTTSETEASRDVSQNEEQEAEETQQEETQQTEAAETEASEKKKKKEQTEAPEADDDPVDVEVIE